MSEENPVKITNVTKTKDPRRVEAGKRLAAISQEAKKRKADTVSAEESQDTPSPKDLKEIGLAVSVLVIVAGAVALYRKFDKKSEGKEENDEKHSEVNEVNRVSEVSKTPKSAVEKRSATKLDSLD